MIDPDAGTIAIQLMWLVILTMINAFFTAAEMAVVSVNKNRIKMLAEDGNKRAALILKISEDSTSFLSTIRSAITMAGFFSSALAATGIAQMVEIKLKEAGISYSFPIAIIIVTILLVYINQVFGELVPKRIALQNAEKFSLFSIKIIYSISKVLAPFIWILSASTSALLSLMGIKNARLEEEVSEEEIKAMLQTGSEAGVFNDIEKEMITSIFSFDDKKAKEVMIPRNDIVAIDIHEITDQVIDEILNSKHSKIPVYEEDIDNIIGVLSMKEYFIKARENSFQQVKIKDIMSEPFFIPENRRIDELFQEMQKKKIHMAILIDEYGGVSGLVTLEDLIEEIVGDIHDEYEEVKQEWMENSDGSFQAAGSILLLDLDDKLHLKLESECDTLSGYLIEQIGHIPTQEELPLHIFDNNLLFTVERMEDRVIASVRITLKDQEE